MNKEASLRKFVKNECANFYEGGCVFDKLCSILKGKRCSYFEKAILGPPDYKHQIPKYDYSKLFRQYAEINENYRGYEVTVRRCKCGELLKSRQRYCAKCSKKRRRESNKKYNRERGG